MKKRLTSILLTLAMVVSLLPAMATPARAVSVSTWDALASAMQAGGEITLASDVTAGSSSTALTVPSDKTVTLDLAGHTINRGLTKYKEDGHVINVRGTLILKDSVGGGKITGGRSTYGSNGGAGGVYSFQGTFRMEGGTITGNLGESTATSRGNIDGITVEGRGFTLAGGIVEASTQYNHWTFNGLVKLAEGIQCALPTDYGYEEYLNVDAYPRGTQYLKAHRTVTLNANGGSVSSSTIEVNYGDPLNLPRPTRDGYRFDGWFTASNGGTLVTSGKDGKAWGPAWTGTYYAHWTANPATVSAAPTAKSLTYDGNAQPLVNAGTASNGTMQYSLSSNSGFGTSVPTGTNAGTYTVYYKAVNNSGGQDSAVGNVSVTIAQKEVGLSWSNTSFTYDGGSHVPTATATGLVSGTSCTVTVTGAQTNAGTHTATASSLSNNNYKLPGTKTTSFTISKAGITPTVSIAGWTYGGTASNPSVSGNTGGGNVTYAYSGRNGTSYNSSTKPTNAGDYTVTATIAETTNYNGATTATASFTISKANITPAVSIAGWTYGDAANAPTLTGNTGNGDVTYTYSGRNGTSYSSSTAPTNAGDYTVTATVAATANYNGGTATKDFTIAKATPGCTAPTGLTATYGNTLASVELADGWTWNNGASSVGNAGTNSFPATFTPSDTANYNTVSENLTVAVSAKTVGAPAIELSPSSFVYDGSAKEPAVTVKDGDTVIPASEYTVSFSDNTNVGTATVTITNNDGGNYVVSGGTTFSITLKPLSLTADITGWTYGGAANAPTLTGNDGSGAVTWEYTVRGADSYSTTLPTAAGDYTVRASVAQTDNYAAGTATADFTIEKAALTVTAKPHTIVKGDAPANDGVTYSGFVNDEDESVLGGALSYAYDTDGNTAGVSFTITPGGLTSGNYAITYVNGTLTVKDTYAVTYYRNYAANDGGITETQRKVEDTALTLSLPAAARTGYTLDGWFSARSGGTQRTDDTYTGNAALDLYAQWTANSYTVKFNANGGTGSMGDMAFTYDEAQALTANAFTRSAYNFVGWAATSDGAVEWNDGATAWNLTADVDGVFTLYAIWTPKPVYRVSGTVVGSDHTTLSGVLVKLMRGNEEIASAITGADGLYVFDAPEDVYNIVATWQKNEETAVTKTQLVVLNANKSYELVMPNGKTNSVLKVEGDDTPPVVVGGLDDEAAAVKAEVEGNESADTKKITVTMTVESKDEDEVTAEATAIKTAASGKTLDYLAITIEKDVDGDKSSITTTNTVLEIVVPYDFAGKQTVEVYRYHGTDAEAMTALDAQPDDAHPAADGTFRLDKDNGLIYIYAQNFSTYAIGYTVPVPVYFMPTTYPPDIPDTPHGNLTVSPAAPKKGDEVTITTKPDDGFEVDVVTVTGPDGEPIPVTDNGDGSYTFTQPDGKVKIEVAFKAVGGTYADCAGDASCPISAFSDAEAKAWYHDGVHWALDNGVMSGYGGAEAGKLGPNDVASRAMMAQILWNLEGRPAVNYAMSYADVDGEAWYADAIRWATAGGIMNGYGNGLFGPDDAMTREQLAAVVHRYAIYKGADVSAASDLPGYTDQDEASAWALPSMRWAVGSGAVLGRTDTTLDPKDSATRAEIATIIKRYCAEISK